jgi:hypothetical protein
MAEALLLKIRAIKTVNDEIIARVVAKKMVKSAYVYSVHPKLSGGLVQYSADVEVRSFARDAVVTATPIAPSAMQCVKDLFNDKLAYSLQSYADVVRLNEEMLPVAEKYLLLREEPACGELRKFLTNYELLQVQLGATESALMDCISKEEVLQSAVKKVNDALKELAALSSVGHEVRLSVDPPPTVVVDRFSALGGAVSSADGREVSLSLPRDQTTVSPCLGTVACSSGAHIWRLDVLQATGWLLFGVLGGSHVPAVHSHLDPLCFAWSSSDVYCAGKEAPETAGGPLPHVLSGDRITLTLDCGKKMLSLSKNGLLHGSMPLPRLGPWRLHLSMYMAPTAIRLR